MTKEEHIEYWIKTADDDWEAVNSLFSNKKNMQALFFSHLVLEKLLKACWVRDNESNFPPRIHNLVRLLQKTTLRLEEEDVQFLEEFNDFQLEGRYPDYQLEIIKRCTATYTKELIEKVDI